MVTISCIIPALNEENNIIKLITSIKNQKLPQDVKIVDIIVIDNGSHDDTIKVASNMGSSVFLKPELTIGGLRNFGASRATGDLLIFLDADNILTEYAIQSLVINALQKEVGAIGIQLKPFDTNKWIPNTWYYHLCPKESGCYEKDTIASGALIMRRDVFFEVGGFNEALDVGEDSELSRTIRRRGYKIIMDSNTVIYNTGYPADIITFIRREFWHGDSWKTILVHKKIDSLTLYLLINLILIFILILRIRKGFLCMLGLLITYLIIPSCFRAYKIRGRMDLMFYQLVILYATYIMARTASLLKMRIR